MDRRTSSGLSKTSCEFTVAEPVLGEMKQVKIRIVVDLPAPFGPRKPTTSPRFTSKFTLSRARTTPNRLVSPLAWIITSVAIRPPFKNPKLLGKNAGKYPDQECFRPKAAAS